MILESEPDIEDFRRRSKGKPTRLPSDVALRLIGKRAEVHPRDVYASVWRDADLAQESARGNREWFGHEVWGPVMIDGGMLTVIDLRPALKREGIVPTDPALPDDYRKR